MENPKNPQNIGGENIITVELEDWYQSFDAIAPEQWDDYEDRIVETTHSILQLFSRYEVKATFFVLGYIARRHSYLIKEIVSAGHEIACHGYYHTPLDTEEPETFRSALKENISAIEDAVGSKVIGYRAPSFSLKKETLWALDILAEMGFKYDSSLAPVGKRQLLKGVVPGIHKTETATGASIIEVPVPAINLFRHKAPVISGAFTRIAPYSAIRFFANRILKKGNPVVLSLHSWEFDAEQPRFRRMPITRYIAHYARINSMPRIALRLFSEYKFCSVKDFLFKNGWLE